MVWLTVFSPTIKANLIRRSRVSRGLDGLHGGGSLKWEPEPGRAAQRENVEQPLSRGYAAEWIDHDQIDELEPDIDLATIGDAPVAYFPEEG
jgi:hypothetical protein